MSIKPELSDLFEYGIDIKNRRIYFGHASNVEDMTEINTSSVENAVRALHKFSSDAVNKPIEIHMNSTGGNPYDMLRLHDEILACPCQIKFFGGGAIMSSATWVLAVCDERYLHPNTTIMIHDGSEGYEGKHTDVQIDAAENKRLQELLYDIYAANSHMPKEFWQDVCQRDLYMSASEAVSVGLADKIIEPKKRGNLRKMRQAHMKKAINQAEIDALVEGMYKRINRLNIPTIKLNKPIKEEIDTSLVIDNTPMPEETEKPQDV